MEPRREAEAGHAMPRPGPRAARGHNLDRASMQIRHSTEYLIAKSAPKEPSVRVRKFLGNKGLQRAVGSVIEKVV